VQGTKELVNPENYPCLVLVHVRICWQLKAPTSAVSLLGMSVVEMDRNMPVSKNLVGWVSAAQPTANTYGEVGCVPLRVTDPPYKFPITTEPGG
jgi:hypothetical protein